MGLYEKNIFMKIFFDLDGTLIDSRVRLYTLFQKLVPKSEFSFEEYWELKRNNLNHSIILKQYFNYFEKEISLFENNWKDLIEDENLLKLDKPFRGVSKYLLSLKKGGINSYLVTSRQFETKVCKQLNDFGWLDVFSDILVTQQKSRKEDIIKYLITYNKNEWIVGDTGSDIQCGKILGLKTVAVLSGFLNAFTLASYNPDIIVENVTLFNPNELLIIQDNY
jgi:phosphoglycolate phosphatase